MSSPVATEQSAHAVAEYSVRSGQMFWALVAIVIGMPASWKTLGLIGKFFSRRFDNRDEFTTRLLASHEREMDIRLEEAKASMAMSKALGDVAESQRQNAESQTKSAEAIMALARSVAEKA